jgi:hypothetical protein
MANLEERKPSNEQTPGEKQTEQDEISNFNQNTDYDASASLHEAQSNDMEMAQFIISNRIYDVLLALLQEQRPDKARDLLELHRSGNLLGTTPSWNGTFLTDLMNEPESPTSGEDAEPEDTVV